MLDITLRVTETPVYLKQIDQIAVHNTGVLLDSGMTIYNVYHEGHCIGQVEHKRSEGALVLTSKVIDLAIRME